MAKQPSFQFYPGDWLKDAELRLCSHFARGLLVDLLCVMFEAKHRGRFVFIDGVTPWSDQQIVDASAGGSREEKLSALDELLRHGVLKRDSQGVVFSARMIRDEEIRLERAEAGSKGGSKTQANRQANVQANDEAKSSSSSSSSSSDITGTGAETGPNRFESPKHEKPTRINAVDHSTCPSQSRQALADLRIKPKKTLDGTLKGIPDEISPSAVASWWRGHIAHDPLTGDTALDLLHVLCAAAYVRKSGRGVENRSAKLAAMLSNGKWVAATTDLEVCYAWIRDHINEWIIKPTEAVA